MNTHHWQFRVAGGYHINATFALFGVPAIAGAATAIVQAFAAARAQNAHDHRGVAYIAVPRDDGTLPPAAAQLARGIQPRRPR